MKRWSALCTLLVVAVGMWMLLNPVRGRPDETVDEDKEKQIAERFLTVLERNPRRGTSLDRVYGYHVERGSLETLMKRYKDRTAKNAKDGNAWMILGMLESQRGKDALALAAFREAEKNLPDNALPSYYLGQTLVLVGQPDAAVEAFERALNRKPARTDLLDIFQALGRVHQRAQHTEKALAVWNRLEKLFPDDPRVQEQIATTLSEEGQYDQALTKYEALAKSTKDDYRKSLFRMEAAGLKVRLGKAPQAIVDFESLLNQLNPDSWLYREVRRKIEEAFLRTDDQAGLAKYYESWVEKNKEDVEAMARLARVLASQGRVPEAQGWLDKALKLAPSRKELRLTFIEQLAYEGKITQAIAQYEALDKNDPNNPDYLREWGKLILKDKDRPAEERKKAAEAIWNRLIVVRPKDPVIATQVADLFRQAEMPEEALVLYKKAVELAPEAAQYREYLGEYYHTLKRSEEALATWREIAAGNNRNAKNLSRLAEVLSGFGYLKESIPVIAEACGLDKDDFSLQLKYADLLSQGEQYEDALKQLALVEKLTANEEEKEAVLQQLIKNYQAIDKLPSQIEALQKELDAGKDTTARRWYLLARYLEAARQLPEATQAVDKALKLDSQMVPALAVSARIHESAGNLLAAAEMNRKLAVIDRRYRTEYLTNVAKLESRLGRRDQALQAGRDLLAAAPGNPDHHKFFAELCFQLGESEEGFDSLRRSVRANPSEPQVLLTLASALADQFRTDEAIELYWRGFEKETTIENKLPIISRLAELYLQTNQFDRLLERLERGRRENDQQREMTICLAQAYQAASDFGTARQELERLLDQNARDTQLLTQLSQLAESEGDIAAATRFQQQLNKVAPGKEGELRLATLLARSGETEEASAIWVKLATGEQEPHRVLQAVDQLLGNGRYETVHSVLERLLREQPRNWELLYREGVILSLMDKKEAAEKQFRTVLDLKVPDDEDSIIIKSRHKNKPGKLANVSRHQRGASFPMQDRINQIWQIRMAAGLDTRDYYQGAKAHAWAPEDFGQARMAAMAWLFNLAQKQGQQEAFLKGMRAEAEKAANQPGARSQWDWAYLAIVRNDNREIFDSVKTLAKLSDPVAQWLQLNYLSYRLYAKGQRSYVRGNNTDNVPPMEEGELNQMVASYESLRKLHPDWLTAAIVTNVNAELKRAKRTQDEERIYREAMQAATTMDNILSAFSMAGGRGDVDGILLLLDKLSRAQGQMGNSGYTWNMSQGIVEAMTKRGEEKAYPDVLRLLDGFLDFNRKFKQAQASSSTSSKRRGNVYNPYSGGGASYQIGSGQQGRQIALDFPEPNDYWDYNGILLLRNAFEIYRKEDLVSDLIAHFRKQGEKTSNLADAVTPQLGVGYMHWWNDDRETALKALNQACDLVPTDLELRMDLARLHERQNEPDEALGIIDAITPLDNQMMQRCEETALRLATMTGNIDRARQAADRLFGLRLDAETQIRLSGQMRQLGMHEAAESILSRARRQVGNRSSSLVNLMLQYQSQNKPETAVQVAYQILRKGPTQSGPSYRGGGDDGEQYRQQAIQVLARSGKLKEMIERSEAQLKNSPKSIQLLQTLAEFYRAANDKDKTKATFLKMAELKPEDAQLRLRVAQYLNESGDVAGSLENYKVAFKKEPSLFNNYYWELQQAFERANKMEELASFMDELDFRNLGRYWSVIEIVQRLITQDKTRASGMKLFKRAWEAFPDQRTYLIGQLYNEELWLLPEVYEYTRKAVIPGVAGDTTIEGWAGIDQIMSYGGDGRVEGVLSRLITAATRQNKLSDLTKEIEESLKNNPDWSAGKAIHAILELRRGNVEAARKELQELLDDKKNPFPMYARWVVGQELENYASLQDLTMKIYEGSIQQSDNDGGIEYSYSPVRRLVQMYQRAGRSAEARDLVLKMAQPKGNPGYPQDYLVYRRLENLSSIAGQLVELGYPVDAVRLYNEALGDPVSIQIASRYYGGGPGDPFTQRLQAGLGAALQGLKPETLGPAVQELLKPRKITKSTDVAIDLTLMVQPRDLQKATLTSMLATTIKAAEGNTEIMTQVRKSATELVEKHPKDFSVQLTAALGAAMEGKPEIRAEAATRLLKLIEETPLEPLPTGTRANSRQRAEALHQVGLWLIARECIKQNALKANGEKLGQRALDASRRQTDNFYSLAILREWGQLALEKGDRKMAEQRWSEMLDLVLTGPNKPKPSTMSGVRFTPVPVPVAPISPVAEEEIDNAPDDEDQPVPAPGVQPGKPATARSATVPVVTTAQFGQAMQIAQLAAENDMPTLSLKAVRDAMRGGPPVQVAMQEEDQMRRVYRSSMGVTYAEEARGGSVNVENSLNNLNLQWQRRKVDPAAVYEVLAAAVLPETRPTEVFLYSRAMGANVNQPRSVGRLAAEWAAKAGKSQDFRDRIEKRQTQPIAELQSRVLLVQLGIASKDYPLATSALEWLGQRVNKDLLQNTAETACHAAMPALNYPELSKPALNVIDIAVKNLSTTPNPEPVGSLRLALARFHFKRNDLAAGKLKLQEYLKGLENQAVRYGGDYGSYQRKVQYERVAREYAHVGQVADVLEMLGQFADAPRYSGGDPSVGITLAILHRLIADRPAPERYELLRTWTMPTATRKVVRHLASFVADDLPPEVFGKLSAPPAGGFVSTADLLIQATKETNQLEALAKELQPLADQKVEEAQGLYLLVQVARGQSEGLAPKLKEIGANMLKEPEQPVDPDRPRPRQQQAKAVQWSDYLLARACLMDPKLRDAGEEFGKQLLELTQRRQDHLFMSRIKQQLAEVTMARNGGKVTPGQDSGLALWHPTEHWANWNLTAGGARAWWFEQEGHLCHLCGPGSDLMFLDYPLTGTFEFSVDCYAGGWGEGNVTYGGLQFDALHMGQGATIRPAGGQESLPRAHKFMRSNAFNRVTIQVEPNKLRCLINGKPWYEEKDPSLTSPWLGLFTNRERQTFFRNFSFKGTPQIPREVSLVQVDRLEGWISNFYNESQPPRLTLGQNQRQYQYDEDGNAIPVPQVTRDKNPDAYDWSATEGVLYGRRTGLVNPLEPIQSRLYYQRPLRDGETLRYEFFCEPDNFMVHPTLGRLAFLLEPTGVRLHWMTVNPDSEWTSLTTENGVEEASCRRGPEKLPLKLGDWNAVQLVLKGDKLSIELNGVQVYERPVEPSNNRQFGFFHYKDRTAVQVRKVLLSGNWPEALTPAQLANPLLKAEAKDDEANRRGKAALIGEPIFAQNGPVLLEQSRQMPAAERYPLLLDWVLPNEQHLAWRLYADFSPTDPAPPIAKPLPAALAKTARLQIGGEIEAPALDLVATAQELNKLEELLERAQKSSTTSETDQRSKLALVALIQAARQQSDAASASLKQLLALLEKVPEKAPEHERWPELLPATRLLNQPALHGPCMALLNFVIEKQMQKPNTAMPKRQIWERHVRHLRALGQVLALPESLRIPFGTEPDLAYWSVVTHPRSDTRGPGDPIPHWNVQRDEVRHYPGHSRDYLYLNVPLQGNFEISCELTSFGWREAQLTYGTLRTWVVYDHKKVNVEQFNRVVRSVPIDPPLKQLPDWYPFRLVVNNGVYTAYVGDRQVHQQTLPINGDPWFAVHQTGNLSGGARNLKITGSPTIPEALKLSDGNELVGWMADYYGETSIGQGSSWTKRGEEIYKPAIKGGVAPKQESLLRYHRPMVEDGEIEYDFYYQPGKAVVHPTLDRLAFLLDPDGVKIHWCTDAQHDRTSLQPDNVAVEQAHRRGSEKLPFKEKDWNKLKLSLFGNQVTLRLNDVEIYERELEPTNLRIFGLFHYADESEIRARNMVYRGNWPKTLPGNEDLLTRRNGTK